MSSRQIKDGRMVLRPEVQGLRDIHIISAGVNDRDGGTESIGWGRQGGLNALTQP